jgi:predicted HAD superfamily Cof-like phosphohydrolase
MTHPLNASEFHRATLVDDPPNMIADVADFHRAMGVPVLSRPGFPDRQRMRLRWKLIHEEYHELYEALGGAAMMGSKNTEANLPDAADAIADLIYVLIGTAHEFGIPLETVWAEVQRSNMAKLGPDGKPVVRGDGKITKPEGWRAPDVEGILTAAGWRP